MSNDVKLKLAIEGFEAVTDKLGKVEQKIGGLAGAIGKMGHIGAALYAIPTALNATVGSTIRAADAITTLHTQLRLATGSAAQAQQAYSALFDIAQQGRVSFTDLGTTFAAISRAGKEMGVSQERLLTVTQSISQAMTIGGGSAAGMNAALVQLGQGLSSGTLRGEELNSIMEQTPRLAKAIADGLGVPIGELRKLGETGQLTGEQVIAALERSGPQLAREMESATLTVGQALTVMGNSAANFIGQVDQAVGLSAKVAQAMQYIAKSMDGVSKSSGSIGFLTNDFKAAGQAMDAAERRGSGFFGQVNQGMAMLIGRTAALQYLSRDFMTLEQTVSDATATLKRLDAQEQQFGHLSIYSMSERATATRDLARANRELAASQKTAASGPTPQQQIRGIDQDIETRAAAAAAKDQASLSALMQKLSGVPQDYIDTMTKIGELHERGALVGDQYTRAIDAAHNMLKKSTPAVKAAADALKEQQKAAADWAKTVSDAAQDQQDASLKSIASLEQQLEKEQEQFAQLGLTQTAVADLEAAKLTDLATDKLRQASVADNIDLSGTMGDRYREEARLLRDLAAAKQATAGKKSELASVKDAIKATDDLAKANQKAAEESSKYWEDALMRAFESGKGFFESLWDTIKNTLKTQVLKVSVQGVMGSLSIGAAGAANASGLFGSASGSFMGNALGSLGTGSLLASNAAYGAAIGTTSIGAGSQAAMLAAQTGEFGAAGLSATAGSAGGFAATAASAMPYVAAALIAYSLFKDNGGTPTQGTGQATKTFDANGNITDIYQKTEWGGLSARADAGITAMQSAYVTQAKALGIGMAQTQFTFGSNTGKDSQGNNFGLGVSVGGKSYASNGGAEQAYSDAAMQLEASRAVFTALQGSALPGYLAKVFDGITASTATQADIDATLQYAGALKTIRESLLETRKPLEILQDAVDTGFTDLGTSADTFKSDFVAAINAGIAPEHFAKWAELGSTMDALAASAKTAADELARTQATVGGAISNFVKSIDSMRKAASSEGVLSAQADIRAGYMDAQQRVNDLMLDASRAALAFSDSIATFLGTLGAGSTKQSLTSLKAQFSAAAALAGGGDAASQDKVVALAGTVLDRARTTSRSAADYARSEAFVRSTLTGVQAAIKPQTLLASTTDTSLADQIAAAQLEQNNWEKLAFDTNTSILKSTDNVALAAQATADQMSALKASYDTAVLEQSAATTQLDVALAALNVLGLSESGLALILATQTSDFATALGVSMGDIKTLTEALGLTQSQVDDLTGKLNIKVADEVYTQLGSALGPVSGLYESLGASVGAPAEFMAQLGTALGLSPIQLAEINNAFTLTADQKLALSNVLIMSREQTDALSTAIGYDNTQISKLATAIGLSPAATTSLTNLDTAIGLALGVDGIIKGLPTAIGFADTATINSLKTGLGVADGVTDTLATSVGLMDGVIADLSNAIGLSGTAQNALTEFAKTMSMANQDYSIGGIYQQLFGRDAETSGRKYWQDSGLQGYDLFREIRDNAQGTDLEAMMQRGYAPNYGPQPGTITPSAYSPATYAQPAAAPDNKELIAEIKSLTAAVAALQKAADSSAASNLKTANTLVRVTRDGEALVTTV